MAKKYILFVGTHNSVRDQMAEGLVNSMFKNNLEAYSAGIMPKSLSEIAVKVMSEMGIDISKQRPKNFRRFC